ncbi:MAG: hypothetical protein H6679_02935 [Epsilonproteobacteria bacterium]|nr:hypothetical protein [Campylobacterota bacterium]
MNNVVDEKSNVLQAEVTATQGNNEQQVEVVENKDSDIPLKPIVLPDDVRSKVEGILKALEILKVDIEKKKETAQLSGDLLNTKVERLVESGQLKIDDKEVKRSVESVTKYVALLDRLIQEILGEQQYFMFLLSSPPAKEFESSEQENHFYSLVEVKIKQVRSYMRRIKKDLDVSYSRYSHGFDMQMKQMSYLEHVVTMRAAHAAKTENKPVKSAMAE